MTYPTRLRMAFSLMQRVLYINSQLSLSLTDIPFQVRSGVQSKRLCRVYNPTPIKDRQPVHVEIR